jgi:hypothetical protein
MQKAVSAERPMSKTYCGPAYLNVPWSSSISDETGGSSAWSPGAQTNPLNAC